jgi:K+ transporter
MIDFQKIFWGGVIHIFIVYMMLDFMYALNREKEFMFRYNKRRKITVIRIVELYKQIELSQNV